MNSRRFLTGVLLLAAVSIILPSRGSAQDWFSGATYEVSVPGGDLKDFADATSWLGFGLGFRKALNKNTTAGLFFGWHVFHEETRDLIQLENGAASGLQNRYVNSFPIMLNYHYYLGRSGDIRPYFGLNGGGYILLQRLDFGVYSFHQDSFEWGVIPEIGAVIPLSRDTSLLLQGKWTYAFTGKGIGGDDMKLQYWSITAGFAWEQY